MKLDIKFILFVLMCFLSCISQSQTVKYDYNNNGSREYRFFYIVPLKSAVAMFPTQEKALLEKEADITEAAFKVYPNPLKDHITISIENWSADKDIKYQLFDLQGTLLRNKSNCLATNKIDLSDISSGIYILRIIYDNNIYDYKLIKSY